MTEGSGELWGSLSYWLGVFVLAVLWFMVSFTVFTLRRLIMQLRHEAKMSNTEIHRMIEQNHVLVEQQKLLIARLSGHANVLRKGDAMPDHIRAILGLGDASAGPKSWS